MANIDIVGPEVARPLSVEQLVPWIEKLNERLTATWTDYELRSGRCIAVLNIGGYEIARRLVELAKARGWRAEYVSDQLDGDFLRFMAPPR